MIKKNNKGFTLIEIIAVVALLGILSILTIPRIFDMVTNNRKDIYVQDAIRLIAKAQYTMNEKSVKIEKPDNGELIIFSMKFLSTSDFQSAPNGGSYLTESSFVVVKNIDGEYVYSTMLVEKTSKGTYMGVELSTESALNAKDAIKHVRVFGEDEIAYIDESTSNLNGGLFINAAFINDFIKFGEDDDSGDWNVDDDDIIGYYNNESESDEDVQDTSSPKITAKFSVGGALQTTLSISAKDADSDISKLKIFLKISHSKSDTYPDTNSNNFEYYGSENVYSKNINFADFGFTYDSKETAYVYIVVVDDTENTTRKRVSYDIHENEKPVINGFDVTHQPEDDYNMPRARITLNVTDDMDAQENLQVCFTQDKDATSCSNYQSYASYFGTNGYYNYVIKDDNGNDITAPNGYKANIKVFVRDSMNEIATDTKTYQIYSNKNPNIKSFTFSTNCYKNSSGACVGNYNDLIVGININIDEDLSSADKLKVVLYQVENSESGRWGVIETTYAQLLNNNQTYNFFGNYDGVPRTLYVEVTDEYGATATTNRTLNFVYKDQAPTITLKKDESNKNIPFIRSYDNPCNGDNTCENTATYGGSYKTELTFQLNDDLTDINDLKVCVSENADDCTKENIDTNKFVKYSNFRNIYQFTPDSSLGNLIYNGSTKSLYAAVVDSNKNWAAYDSYKPINYKVYQNQKPYIAGSYNILPTGTYNTYAVKLDMSELKPADDFGSYQVKFCYTIGTDPEICTPYQNYTSLKSELSSYYELLGPDGKPARNNGSLVRSKFKIKDNYGEEDQTGGNGPRYVLYTDGAPHIDSCTVTSSTEGYNNFVFNLDLKVTDYDDEYSVCVSNNSSCEGGDFLPASGELYSGMSEDPYTLTINGHDTLGWDEHYQDENHSKTFYVVVKDTYGHTAYKKMTYTTYSLCSNSDYMDQSSDEPEYVLASEQAISPSYCNGKCYRDIKTTSNRNHVNYIMDANNVFSKYNKITTFMDTLVNEECDVTTEEKMYCNYVDCFNTGHEENPNLISMNLLDENNVWYYSNARVTREVLVDKPYCDESTLSIDDYFSPKDERCADTRCEAYAGQSCLAEIGIYNNLISIYEDNEKTALEDYLILKFSSEEDMIKTCKPLFLHMDDQIDGSDGFSSWMRTQYSFCSSMGSGQVQSGYEDLCDALEHITDCFNLEELKDENDKTYKELRRAFIANYEQTNPRPEKTTCIEDYVARCEEFYSFCSEPVSEYREIVDCNLEHDVGPIYCTEIEYTRGICLQSDCQEGDDRCRKVCYKTYDCTPEYEQRPVTFTCNGYYKTYKSIVDGDNILLKETPLRICPDFMRLFPQFFEFDGDADYPFIRFDPAEIEVRQNG